MYLLNTITIAGLLAALAEALPWVTTLCASAVLAGVAVNFIFAKAAGPAQTVRRSPVATLTMVAFFVGIYELIHLRIWIAPVPWPAVQLGLLALGQALVVLGCLVNLAGRFKLGYNWADQATLYTKQSLVTSGVYGLVRHPLYASLCWMFLGASLAYFNAAALTATVLLFIPAMYWRARIEERLLRQAFPEYMYYQKRVGMLFPHF